MQIRPIDLRSLPADAWNRLRGPDRDPFLSHAFLAGLEVHGCVGEHWGWVPRHLGLFDRGQLLGAVPLYLKFNSYGELVFDFAWADAYRRAGMRYYPKLVSAVPYSPVTGPRLLLHPQAPGDAAARLAEAVAELASEHEASSVHVLFPQQHEAAELSGHGYFERHDVQFHWHNRGYRDFDDYLERFTAERRKKVRRERRQVTEAGIEIELLHGHEVDDATWRQFHRFYADTFDRRGGHPTLTEDFFAQIGRELRSRVVLVMARANGEYIAGALSLRSDDTLFGRHWGCQTEVAGLHFEACYYSGIDYCIRHGLKRFEPGAQGEHKVWRGFEPAITRSAHRMTDPRFHAAVGNHVAREREAMQAYMRELEGHLPFKCREAEPPS